MPRVSILLPFFNAQSFLAEALEGVLHQTWSDWELIMVDDGSTDGSRPIADRAAEKLRSRASVVEHPGRCNRGPAASRNLALSRAGGEFIALLDADDLWATPKLERQLALLDQHQEAGWLYGSPTYWHSWTGDPADRARDVTPGPGILTETVHRPPSLVTELYPLTERSAPCPSDLLLRRDVLMSVGGFEESFGGRYMMYEDQALLVKLYLTESAYVSSESWTWYRVHSQQMGTVMAPFYHEARRFFLDWFEGYLRRSGVDDPAIWASLRQSQGPYRHPAIWTAAQWLRRLRGLPTLTFPPSSNSRTVL